jgi:hypothetical protein
MLRKIGEYPRGERVVATIKWGGERGLTSQGDWVEGGKEAKAMVEAPSAFPL